MDVVAYFILLAMLMWFYVKMFKNQSFLAGVVSGFLSIVTMEVFVRAYNIFGNNGIIGVCVILGILYYIFVIRRTQKEIK